MNGVFIKDKLRIDIEDIKSKREMRSGEKRGKKLGKGGKDWLESIEILIIDEKKENEKDNVDEKIMRKKVGKGIRIGEKGEKKKREKIEKKSIKNSIVKGEEKEVEIKSEIEIGGIINCKMRNF